MSIVRVNGQICEMYKLSFIGIAKDAFSESKDIGTCNLYVTVNAENFPHKVGNGLKRQSYGCSDEC